MLYILTDHNVHVLRFTINIHVLLNTHDIATKPWKNNFIAKQLLILC